MSDFGKLNFSTSFNPTSAFPLDARCYFTDLPSAEAAASTAEEVGSSNTVYYYGMRLLVDDGNNAKWYTIQRDGTLLADDDIKNAQGTGYVVGTEPPEDTRLLWIDPSDTGPDDEGSGGDTGGDSGGVSEDISAALNEIDILIGGGG